MKKKIAMCIVTIQFFISKFVGLWNYNNWWMKEVTSTHKPNPISGLHWQNSDDNYWCASLGPTRGPNKLTRFYHVSDSGKISLFDFHQLPCQLPMKWNPNVHTRKEKNQASSLMNWILKMFLNTISKSNNFNPGVRINYPASTTWQIDYTIPGKTS